jgi:hypothetical protein
VAAASGSRSTDSQGLNLINTSRRAQANHAGTAT